MKERRGKEGTKRKETRIPNSLLHGIESYGSQSYITPTFHRCACICYQGWHTKLEEKTEVGVI